MVPLKLNKGRKSILGGKKMRKSVLVVILFLFFVSFIPLNAQWARTYDGGSDHDEARCVQQTSDGGYIVVGETQLFGVYMDIWVLKLSSSGDIEWQKTYGGSYYEFAQSIQQTDDGGYIVAGYTNSYGVGGMDFWVMKLSSSGDIEWQRTYGGYGYDYAYSIQQTDDGGYIVAGTKSFVSGLEDIWVLKLSSSGDIEWQKTYEESDYEWPPSIQQTSDGGYIVAGTIGPFGNKDFWVMKLSSTGDIEWQRTYGGSSHDEAQSIQQTIDGGYVIAGSTGSFGILYADFWIIKLGLTGEIEWQKTYGGSDVDYAQSIQQTDDGGYIVAGSTRSFGAGDMDFWVLKLDSTGAIEWQKTYGGSDYEWLSSIQQTDDGGYIAAGSTESFGADGENDIWILKLFPDGDIHSSCGFIESSDATITDTFVFPEDTFIIPQDTDTTPLDTTASSQDSNAIVTLLCETPEYTLTISATTGGTTDPVSGTYTYDSGTEVSVQATANSGYNFTGWSGDASGTTNPITITMDSDKSVTANFEAIPETPEHDEGDGNGGGCFIATTAYGSPLHPHIDVLREFRDQYLVTNKVGQALVNFYYRYSPSIANFISKHKLLKIAVRIHLRPLISLSYFIVH